MTKLQDRRIREQLVNKRIKIKRQLWDLLAALEFAATRIKVYLNHNIPSPQCAKDLRATREELDKEFAEAEALMAKLNPPARKF